MTHEKINATRYLSALLLASLALFSLTAYSDSIEESPSSQIIVFGDSHSDTGNFYRDTGQTFPNEPYFQGRASNGLLWIEYLADSLNLDLLPENQYAYFGAESGTGNFHNQPPLPPFPGFHQQIDSFFYDHDEQIGDPDTLLVVWVGSYDFYAWLANGEKDLSVVVENGITNIIMGLTALVDAGVKHLLIVNLPDLGSLPLGINLDPEIRQHLSISVAAFNTLLDDAIVAIAQLHDIQVTRIDAYEIINTVMENGEAFGFANVHESAIDSERTEISDVFLFWDSTHLTTVGHEILADFALQALFESYAPIDAPILRNDSTRAIQARYPR